MIIASEETTMSAALFDVSKLVEEVDAEIDADHLKDAKKKLITKRREIKNAERIVRNLEREYALLLLEITDNA
jgi:hypothetical protein